MTTNSKTLPTEVAIVAIRTFGAVCLLLGVSIICGDAYVEWIFRDGLNPELKTTGWEAVVVFWANYRLVFIAGLVAMALGFGIRHLVRPLGKS